MVTNNARVESRPPETPMIALLSGKTSSLFVKPADCILNISSHL